mmetsp:Transcript_69482/g.115811  ORF Transcript_69482/g.115811 Transcript_69482/m.115811 type:complete len:291 (-) Transcript_69482:512-1384(-)
MERILHVAISHTPHSSHHAHHLLHSWLATTHHLLHRHHLHHLLLLLSLLYSPPLLLLVSFLAFADGNSMLLQWILDPRLVIQLMFFAVLLVRVQRNSDHLLRQISGGPRQIFPHACRQYLKHIQFFHVVFKFLGLGGFASEEQIAEDVQCVLHNFNVFLVLGCKEWGQHLRCICIKEFCTSFGIALDQVADDEQGILLHVQHGLLQQWEHGGNSSRIPHPRHTFLQLRNVSKAFREALHVRRAARVVADHVQDFFEVVGTQQTDGRFAALRNVPFQNHLFGINSRDSGQC